MLYRRINRVSAAFAFGICIGLLFPVLLHFLEKHDKGYITNSDIRNFGRYNEPWVIRSHRQEPVLDSGLYRKSHAANDTSTRSHQPPDTEDNPGTSQQRKILLDCGANIASTIMMFRETYPGGEDFIIHSFEIDDRLAPYFAPYDGVNLHCPVGVSDVTGHMTAYSEAPWSPDKGLNKGKDMQWGGGTLFVSDDEKKDNKTGGSRQLSHRKQIPVVDLSRWIQNNTSPEDYIIFKLDVEGAEFDILNKMLKDGTFKWIDKMYGEYHYSQPHGWTKKGRDRIKAQVKQQGFQEVDWAGEQRDYGDFNEMHPVNVAKNMLGKPGTIYARCQSNEVTLAVAVGMNYKRAKRLIETISAYPVKVPVMLFFYGDFVQQFPGAVARWSQRFDMGIREDSHYPPGHFEIMAYNWIRAALVSAEMKFRDIGIQPAFYLPVRITKNVTANAKARGFRIVKPSAVFPPPSSYPVSSFNLTAYYTHRDVERIPKALRVIYQQLQVSEGGILVLDSDLPDSFMNIVFLLDYLVHASEFSLVDIGRCVRKN